MVETARLAVAGGATLIVNDDAEAAIAIGADGLHIGQDDLSAAKARARIGPDAILGLSVETPDQAARVDAALVDYVGAGPVFATSIKPGHAQPVGFEGLAALIAVSPVPAVAIGGLKAQHVRQTLAAGAKGVAVISAICGQPDPEAAARAIRAEVFAMT